jgi:hypothetical protein
MLRLPPSVRDSVLCEQGDDAFRERFAPLIARP